MALLARSISHLIPTPIDLLAAAEVNLWAHIHPSCRLYLGMPISARNKLRGTIEEIQFGDIMAHVVVRVGDN